MGCLNPMPGKEGRNKELGWKAMELGMRADLFSALFQGKVAALSSSSHPGPSTSFPGDSTTQSRFAAEFLLLLAKPGEMTDRGKIKITPKASPSDVELAPTGPRPQNSEDKGHDTAWL